MKPFGWMIQGDSMRKTLIRLLSIMLAGMLLLSGCSITNGSETKKIYKDKQEVELAAETYLKEKYGKEFSAAVTDSPNHLYTSYALSAYAVDDVNKESFDVTVTYYDEETYGVTDDYFMYSINDDLESWFKELADPYIESDFKAFYLSSGSLPSDYKDCKTFNDFLKLSPTSTYYGLRYLIVLPATEWDAEINKVTDCIAREMLSRRIRGQVTIVVYEDENVYDKILTQKDERHFWTHLYRVKCCTSTLKTDFSIATDDKALVFGTSKEIDK
ncbi:MAG: hypothetical protein QM689_04635 [Oscillospiraceae bacterium]